MIKLVDKNSLNFNGIEIRLEFSIDEVVEIGNKIIVLFSPTGELYKSDSNKINRNIICIDRNGSIIWRIEKVENIFRKDENPYSGMELLNGDLRVYNTNGYFYFVDLNDGSVKLEQNQRPW